MYAVCFGPEKWGHGTGESVFRFEVRTVEQAAHAAMVWGLVLLSVHLDETDAKNAALSGMLSSPLPLLAKAQLEAWRLGGFDGESPQIAYMPPHPPSIRPAWVDGKDAFLPWVGGQHMMHVTVGFHDCPKARELGIMGPRDAQVNRSYPTEGEARAAAEKVCDALPSATCTIHLGSQAPRYARYDGRERLFGLLEERWGKDHADHARAVLAELERE